MAARINRLAVYSVDIIIHGAGSIVKAHSPSGRFRPQEKGRGPGTLPNLFYVCLLELLLLIFLVLLLLVLLVLGLVVALIVLGLIVLGAVLIAILLVVAHKTHLFSRP